MLNTQATVRHPDAIDLEVNFSNLTINISHNDHIDLGISTHYARATHADLRALVCELVQFCPDIDVIYI